MNATGTITMTMRELDRFKVIQDMLDGRIRPWRAAERLGLTTRQIRRLVAQLREHGPEGLVSRKRSRPSNNRLDASTANRALSIIRERYADFGPTLACEKPWDPAGEGNRQEAHDRRRALGTEAATPSKGLPAPCSARMPGRAHPDRRQRPPLIRGARAGLHVARVRG